MNPRRGRERARVTIFGDARAFTATDCARLGTRLGHALHQRRWRDAAAIYAELRTRGRFELVLNDRAKWALGLWARTGGGSE